MILAIRTDKPEVYIGLWVNGGEIAFNRWEAGRELSVQLNINIGKLLEDSNNIFKNLSGIVLFEGPGSYTGLRIGTSVANAIGYSLQIPIVATGGKQWLEASFKKLYKNKKYIPVSPKYGGQIFTTKPKK